MYRPRSIVRLILIGFAVVLAPLIVAVLTAVVQVDRLAQQSQDAVLEAETATQQGRSLVEQLTQMQRAVGQYRVLGDDALHQAYLDRRAAFVAAGERLRDLNLSTAGRKELIALLTEERQLHEALENEDGGQELDAEALNEAWAALAARARAVLGEASRMIETQAASAMRNADRVQRTLLLQAAAVIPATLVLAGVFVVLINRPMRQIGAAIRRLGGRELAGPIEVQGPRDVEELGRQLDWLRRRIAELEEQKVTFVRHISHELKTPLTTIREGAELLAESLADSLPEEAEISRIMRADSLRLQKLIEDLLQFGKTQEIVTDLRVAETVDLEAVVREVIAGQRVSCAAKSITLHERVSPVEVRADPNKVRIVIDNLLTNAVKFTPPNGDIRVSLTAADGFALVDVRDSGPGIAAHEAERIFEPFVQGTAEYQSSVKGTGLGLAIAREYAEAHGGYVKVMSSERGAHFRAAFALDGPALPARPVPTRKLEDRAA